MLGAIMVSYHNLVYYQNFLRSLRDAIRADRVDEFRSVHLADVPASL
jgi:tRNA-guanine family transglycosylase